MKSRLYYLEDSSSSLVAYFLTFFFAQAKKNYLQIAGKPKAFFNGQYPLPTNTCLSMNAKSNQNPQAKAPQLKEKQQESLLIVDAHAMAYRAHFAMERQGLTNQKTGKPTGAIYGFFGMLFKLLFDLHPKSVAIVWDPPKGKSFRNELFPKYKAQRKSMPDDLREQIRKLQKLIPQCGFATLMEQGFEADDLMGSLAKRFSKTGEVLLLSGDKDCYQLLGKNVKMLRPKAGVTHIEEIDANWVQENLGVSVQQIPDYMGLVGDSADNIPGAKGVGPKSASKLLQEYKSIDGIYKNIDKITAKALKRNLLEHKEEVYLSKKLAIIKTDMPSVHKLKQEALLSPNVLQDKVINIFKKEGFNRIYTTLRKRQEELFHELSQDKLASENKKTPTKSAKSRNNYKLIKTERELKECLKNLSKALQKKNAVLSLDTETDNRKPMQARLVGISLSVKAKEAYFISSLPEDSPYYEEGLPRAILQKEFVSFIKKTNPKIIGQNIKYDILVLKRAGIELPDPYFDTMLASYLCNPHLRQHNMDDMALIYLDQQTIPYEEVAGKGRSQTTMDKLPPEKISDYACEDAEVTLQLYNVFKKKIKEEKLEKLHSQIEMPLIPVLVDMEMAGVAIDRKHFSRLQKQYNKKIEELTTQIHKLAGRIFNIRSNKELQNLLFSELGLGKKKGDELKKLKSGYSTDQSNLKLIEEEHEIVSLLLDYRKYTKLQSTYIEALPAMCHPTTGRLHTNFHQAIAATGRLSSVEPNLQNIPIREDTGRAIRRGFVPSEGNELLSLDYSQIELRIMAHYSKDEALLEVFREGNLDIHRRTAANLYQIPEEKITADMRSIGKTINFSIIYGVTTYGLHKSLNITQQEAALFIKRFFESYPGVKKYMEDCICFAQKNAYVATLLGRKRPIPQINAKNKKQREAAERTAINSPIQGTSADIIKLAMIDIHKKMKKNKMSSKMILQVHDELIFDVFPPEKTELLALAKDSMENSMQLLVPLKVDYGFGKNWDELH